MNTNWIEPDAGVGGAARRRGRSSLLADAELGAYAERLAERAERIVLGTTLLKLTVPGVPDLYQGDELPSLALVDPGQPAAGRLGAAPAAARLAEPPPKLELIREALALRARRPAAFAAPTSRVEAGEDVVRVHAAAARCSSRWRSAAISQASAAAGRVARRRPHARRSSLAERA